MNRRSFSSAVQKLFDVLRIWWAVFWGTRSTMPCGHCDSYVLTTKKGDGDKETVYCGGCGCYVDGYKHDGVFR